MPTALVPAKSVPATATEAPGAWAVSVNVMAAVAALVIGMAARTIESVRKAMMAIVHTFFLCCTFYLLNFCEDSLSYSVAENS
jgi:uncharacterized membrane protein YozB (DUF420 family)